MEGYLGMRPTSLAIEWPFLSYRLPHAGAEDIRAGSADAEPRVAVAVRGTPSGGAPADRGRRLANEVGGTTRLATWERHAAMPVRRGGSDLTAVPGGTCVARVALHRHATEAVGTLRGRGTARAGRAGPDPGCFAGEIAGRRAFGTKTKLRAGETEVVHRAVGIDGARVLGRRRAGRTTHRDVPHRVAQAIVIVLYVRVRVAVGRRPAARRQRLRSTTRPGGPREAAIRAARPSPDGRVSSRATSAGAGRNSPAPQTSPPCAGASVAADASTTRPRTSNARGLAAPACSSPGGPRPTHPSAANCPGPIAPDQLHQKQDRRERDRIVTPGHAIPPWVLRFGLHAPRRCKVRTLRSRLPELVDGQRAPDQPNPRGSRRPGPGRGNPDDPLPPC